MIDLAQQQTNVFLRALSLGDVDDDYDDADNCTFRIAFGFANNRIIVGLSSVVFWLAQLAGVAFTSDRPQQQGCKQLSDTRRQNFDLLSLHNVVWQGKKSAVSWICE